MKFVHDIDPILFHLGVLNIYWYSLFFALGVLLCYFLLKSLFRREGLQLRQLESLMVYVLVGMFAGARLGYVFFYQPDYYLSQPLEIPKLWKPGLSSHGGALGILVAVLLWSRIYRQNFFRFMSLLSLGLPIILCFVRIGNFFNSEALGIPTQGDWGVVFARLGETFPRHPSQLYEALITVGILLLLLQTYRRHGLAGRPALLTLQAGLLYFTARFLLDFSKPGTLPLDGLPVSLQQILSIPPIVTALCYLTWIKAQHKKH